MAGGLAEGSDIWTYIHIDIYSYRYVMKSRRHSCTCLPTKLATRTSHARLYHTTLTRHKQNSHAIKHPRHRHARPTQPPRNARKQHEQPSNAHASASQTRFRPPQQPHHPKHNAIHVALLRRVSAVRRHRATYPMHGSAQPTIRRNATSYQHPTRHPTCADAHLPNTSRLRPSLCGRYSASWPPRALHPRSPTPPALSAIQCMAARNQPSGATQHPTSTRRDILPARTPTSPTPAAFALPFAGVTAHHGLRAPYTLVRLPPHTQRDRTTVQHSNTAPYRSTTLYRPPCDTKPLTFAYTSNISPTHMAACLFQLYTTRMVTQVAVHGAKARARI